MDRLKGKKKNPDKYLGKASIIKARTGFGVSFTHANDAAALRLIYKQAAKEGIDIASVHDAVVGNIADLDKMRSMGRRAYAGARSADVIRGTLKLMRNQGMSEDTYRALLKDAEERGLFAEEYTGEDILERKGSDYHYYGWDY
jgi:DNA-directed RNA polymerase